MKYDKPELEVVIFLNEDVVRTSSVTVVQPGETIPPIDGVEGGEF